MTVDSSLKDADHKMEQALVHMREDLSSEKLEDRVRRMQLQLDK